MPAQRATASWLPAPAAALRCSHVCGHSCQDDVADAPAAQYEVEVCSTAQHSTFTVNPACTAAEHATNSAGTVLSHQGSIRHSCPVLCAPRLQPPPSPVAQKDPFPGLSITTSPSAGASSCKQQPASSQQRNSSVACDIGQRAAVGQAALVQLLHRCAGAGRCSAAALPACSVSDGCHLSVNPHSTKRAGALTCLDDLPARLPPQQQPAA